MAATNDYWDSRIQIIYDEHYKSLAVDDLYRAVYERLHSEVSALYFALKDRDLKRSELYKAARFLSFRSDLQRCLEDISGSMNDKMSRALVKAYKDAGLAAKDSLGKKSVWTVQNRHMAEACVTRKWAGDNFSGRIWKNRDQLAKQIEHGISTIVITGMGRNDLLRELNKTDYRERFVPPAGASQDEAEQLLEAYLQRGRRQADCLVRTELMHTLNTAQIETYRSEGVNYLEFDCEPTACPHCLDIAKSNPHPINKIPCTIGHPNCRCTWLAVEDEDVEDIRRQYAEPQSEKTVDNSAESGIIKSRSDTVAEITTLGKVNKEPLEKEFGALKTDEIIITNERIKHIQNRHPEDYELFEKYAVKTIEAPDIIIKDDKNDNTVFMVKKLATTNLNVVAKLILDIEDNDLKNSVMTFYRIRERNLRKLQNKNKVLYKSE